MPKLKKAAKNSYFFFITERRKRAEAEGYRIRGGFQEASNAFGFEWGQLSKEERAPYEEMAKEAKGQDKHNINNKFTTSGESYAQVQAKVDEQRYAQQLMEKCISSLTSGPDSGDRIYIFVKCVHSIEMIADKMSRSYVPAEFSMAAFSLKGGLWSVYTTLIDSQNIPRGYASAAMESSEETLLPLPGDSSYTGPTRDYLDILRKIFGFANHWLDDGYNIPGHPYPVFFCANSEREIVVSGLQWLVDHLVKDDKKKYQDLVKNLKVYDVNKLIKAMAVEAVNVNPEYTSYIVQHKADDESIFERPTYDYVTNIACSFHQSPMGIDKMQNCAQNNVMRRSYLLLDHFGKAYKYERIIRHEIRHCKAKLQELMVVKKRQVVIKKEEKKVVVEPAWLKDGPKKRSPSPTSAFPGIVISPKVEDATPAKWWDDNDKKEETELREWGKASPQKVSWIESDFPTLNVDDKSTNKSGESGSWIDGGGVSGSWAGRGRGRGSSVQSPPQQTSSSGGRGLSARSSTETDEWPGFTRRSPPRSTSASGRGRGLSSAPTSGVFDDKDFTTVPSSKSSGGRGRGRGRITEESDW